MVQIGQKNSENFKEKMVYWPNFILNFDALEAGEERLDVP
ncbi:hypothetical protein ABEDC_0998 [Acinetobacter lwoffii]|nr:hypothetical protein ABEDC_0998 [Acinetobacter lwoffii]